MKKIVFTVLFLLSAAYFACASNVTAGVSLSPYGNSYFLSIGNYFSVPQREVREIRKRRIPDEEVPVVFFLAREARVEPETIVSLRLKGKSWQAIVSMFGLGPEIFYVPVDRDLDVGPPYGHAYGYYRNRPRRDWRRMRLGDDEIVNLVNLKFMSEQYRFPSETIMRERRQNKRFDEIGDDLDRQRYEGYGHGEGGQGAPGHEGNDDDDNPSQGHGHGYGHGHGHGHGDWHGNGND